MNIFYSGFTEDLNFVNSDTIGIQRADTFILPLSLIAFRYVMDGFDLIH